MTNTADSSYIQAVSVGFRRSPSSLSTRSDVRVKSALNIAGYELRGDNLRRREEALSRMSSDDCISARREKAQMMQELMFLYGLNEYVHFKFPSHSSKQMQQARSKLGNAWSCENEAFRQMYNSSSRLPRRRPPLKSSYPLQFPIHPVCVPESSVMHVTGNRHNSTRGATTTHIGANRTNKSSVS